MFNFLFGKQKYNKKSVEYVMKEILRQTIDRDLLKKEIGKYLDEKQIVEFYENINRKEILKDHQCLNKWMKKLEDLNNNKIFD